MIDPGWSDLAGKVDVLLRGSPCQGYSNLNNRTRRADRRNVFFILTVPAIAVALGAKAVVIENVPDVVNGRLGIVATTTALLETSGYRVGAGTLERRGHGLATIRSRFFLVAMREYDPIDLKTVANGLAAPDRDG